MVVSSSAFSRRKISALADHHFASAAPSRCVHPQHGFHVVPPPAADPVYHCLHFSDHKILCLSLIYTSCCGRRRILSAAAHTALSTYQRWPDRIWFNVLHGSGKRRQR